MRERCIAYLAWEILAFNLVTLPGQLQKGALAFILKGGGGHVVVLLPAARVALQGNEDFSEQVGGRDVAFRFANLLDARDPEYFFVDVESVGDSVGAKQDEIAWLQRDGTHVVLHILEQAGRNPGDFEDAATS